MQSTVHGGEPMKRGRLVLYGVLAVLIFLIILIPPRLRGPEMTAPVYWPTEGWRSSTPEEQGIDSARLADALLAIREKGIKVHSLMLIRNGYVVVEAYFYPYDGKYVHDLASVTKTVTTTLLGIAADQGKLQLDQPVISFFSDRSIANYDHRKERITVGQLASMSSGLECTSERDEATLKEMWTSPDWLQFVLDRPVRWEPGTQFVYCSPGSYLLSAVLQKATGMTSLEFARANLFEPLGIRDVIWPDDPQGITHGWGDIRLHTRDAAKLGYLWLNKGVWEGRQIVSRQWVETSVMPQLSTGEEGSYYGYGWWVNTGELESYRADGRGGQYVAVVPELNLILATTGGGFELDDLDDLLLPALVDMRKPLPGNPAALSRLQAAVGAVARASKATTVLPLPPMAHAISGKTFAFGANPLGIETLRIHFNDSAEAVMHIKLADSRVPRQWPIGLDGVYRMTKGEYDHPLGLRGYWSDAQTFVFEYAGITSNDHYTLRVRFESNRVVIKAQETAHELGVTIVGRPQSR